MTTFSEQINEFGQAPRQLFTTPHPPRLLRRKATIVDNATLSNYSIKSEGFRGLSMEFVSRIMALASSHAENPTPEPAILSAGVKFQIPAEPSIQKSSSARPLGAQGKFRPGTPLPSAALRSATEESESDTEESFLASTSDVAYFERSRGNESVSETSSSGIESLAAEDPFDVIRDVEIRLPNLLKKTSKKGKVSFPEEVGPKECEQQKSVVHECSAPQPTPTKKGTGWHQLFRKDIAEPQCIKLHRGPVNALVISEENAAGSLTMYSIGKDGFIKVGHHSLFNMLLYSI
jgi:factor associated with neutral sphingomyelinase activation